MSSLLKWALLTFVVLTTGCATMGTHTNHPPALTLNELKSKMNLSMSDIETLRGEARISYFGPQGRLKGTVTIAAARPGSFRYNVLGPHGGVIEAFATDGRELQVLKLLETRYLYGPASADTLDRLMAFAPLNLDSAGWVGLLFGMVTIPEGASLASGQRHGEVEVSWQVENRTIRLGVNESSGTLERLRMMEGETLVSEVIISERDGRGLPAALEMRAPAAKVELEFRLREVEVGVTFAPGTFYIEPPAGFRAEYVGTSRPPVD
ncbi:MAG: hypothetical protein VX834_07900 [Myxococcota bacterium]|nr:hypothetical protein [Myxococcota bacterium]